MWMTSKDNNNYFLTKYNLCPWKMFFCFFCFCSLEGGGGYFFCCFCFFSFYIFNNRILYLKWEINLHNSHIDIVSETKFHRLIFYSKLHSLPELSFLVFTSTCHSFLSFIKWKTINWFDLIWFLVLKETFSYISAISWRPVLVVEEAGIPGENNRSWTSNCWTLSLEAANRVHIFLKFTKPGTNPRRIGDRLVWVVRSSNYLTHWATRSRGTFKFQ
jgi:hypothetical protein